MIRVLALLSALLLPLTASAESVVAGLSQNQVSITASFDGSEILVFGAVKRFAPPPPGDLEVVVAIMGPNRPVTVRRKSREFGIWINTSSVVIDAAPSFYAVATSTDFNKAISIEDDLRYRISIDRAVRIVAATTAATDPEAFKDALIRLRKKDGLYQLNENAVQLREETLFRTAVTLPSNLTEGIYSARIYLTRNGQVVDAYETGIYVTKVGLERWVFNLAHEHSLIYGLLALVIAGIAGWGASEAFRMLRR